jgi:Fe-S-cluster-containing hydrogenase component 2
VPHVMISRRRCTGCRMCELACSAWHEGAYRPSLSRLHVEVNPTTANVNGFTCLQTACAECERACPEGAIERQLIEVRAVGMEPVTGYVLKVNEKMCTGCGKCYDVCPRGVIRPHPGKGVAYKCDLCDGEPHCIAFCQNPRIMAIQLRLSRADRERAEV